MDDIENAAAASDPAEAFKTINVQTPFTVIVNVGQGVAPFKVAAGVQRVPAVVADHWYTQAHLASGGFGTPEYAAGARASADEAFVKARDAALRYQELEDAARAAEQEAGLAPVEPAYLRLAAAGVDDGGGDPQPDPDPDGEDNGDPADSQAADPPAAEPDPPAGEVEQTDPDPAEPPAAEKPAGNRRGRL